MENNNNEGVMFGSDGHFKVWFSSGPVKTFIPLFLIFMAAIVGSTIIIKTLWPILIFSGITIWIFNSLLKLLPKRPELFQDSKTWLMYQKFIVGNKQKGLYEMRQETQLFQPEIQTTTKTISGKARIIKN